MSSITQAADAHDPEIPSAKRQRLNSASEGDAWFPGFECEGIGTLSSVGEIVCFGMVRKYAFRTSIILTGFRYPAYQPDVSDEILLPPHLR